LAKDFCPLLSSVSISLILHALSSNQGRTECNQHGLKNGTIAKNKVIENQLLVARNKEREPERKTGRNAELQYKITHTIESLWIAQN
jgi:hypothetical protein